MDYIDLNSFLNKLVDSKIFFRINKVRHDGIMVEVAVPGQRWEVEFMDDGTLEIEKFVSDGRLYDCSALDSLFKDFID